MIIDDFNTFRSQRRPVKTNPELRVDSNAVLTGPIPFQQFQAIPRRNSEVIKFSSDFQLPQLSASDLLDGHEFGHSPARRKGFGFLASEGLNHNVNNSVSGEMGQLSVKCRAFTFLGTGLVEWEYK